MKQVELLQDIFTDAVRRELKALLTFLFRSDTVRHVSEPTDC